VAEVHFEAGYVPASQSVGDFAQAMRSIGEPVHGKTAEDVSMGRILLQLLDYTQTFGMQMRPELVLLQKTMVQVEGVARTIDPSLNIWTAAEPVVKNWIQNSFGPQGAARLVAGNIKEVADRLKRLPDMMDRFEANLDANDSNLPPPRDRFAPWWGWFGLAIVLAGFAYAAIIAVQPN
jgi:ubiquinone biosynthesis protein